MGIRASENAKDVGSGVAELHFCFVSDAVRLISSKLTCNGVFLNTRENFARNSSMFSESFMIVTTLSI